MTLALGPGSGQRLEMVETVEGRRKDYLCYVLYYVAVLQNLSPVVRETL